MPLFGKKLDDAEWIAEVSVVAEVIAQTCEVFEVAGRVVEADPIAGWRAEAEKLSNLGVYERDVEAAKKKYKSAGNPKREDLLVSGVKEQLDRFFDLSWAAFHWGKLHYSDASGGPGQRALYETGFAQRAAATRVVNNGRQFAENALGAAKAGRAALELWATDSSRDRRPSLADLLVEAAQPGVWAELRRRDKVPLSQIVVFGAWCYSRAAILGMIVSLTPSPFVACVWDPTKGDGFWQLADEEAEGADSFPADVSLGSVRMQSLYRQALGEDWPRVDAKQMARAASSTRPLSEARVRWAHDVAAGFGLGCRRPELVKQRLEGESHPDAENWKRAHDAGLDIPAEPDVMTAAEHIGALIEVCRPLCSPILRRNCGNVRGGCIEVWFKGGVIFMSCEEVKVVEAAAKKRLLEVEAEYLKLMDPRLGRMTAATPDEVEEMRKAGSRKPAAP